MTGEPGNGDRKEMGDPYSAEKSRRKKQTIIATRSGGDGAPKELQHEPLSPLLLPRSLGAGEVDAEPGKALGLDRQSMTGDKAGEAVAVAKAEEELGEELFLAKSEIKEVQGRDDNKGGKAPKTEVCDPAGAEPPAVSTDASATAREKLDAGGASGAASSLPEPTTRNCLPPAVLSDAIAAAYRQGFQQGVSIMSSASTGVASATGGQLAPFLAGLVAPGADASSEGGGGGGEVAATGIRLPSRSAGGDGYLVGNGCPPRPGPGSDLPFRPFPQPALSPPPQLQHLVPPYGRHGERREEAASAEPFPPTAPTSRASASTAALRATETRANDSVQGDDGTGEQGDDDMSADAARRERARMRASNRKDYIEMISGKKQAEMSMFERKELKSWEVRRSKKNIRSRERSLEVKERVRRILETAEHERSEDDAAFLQEYTSRQQRKNEGDRLRRERIRKVSGGKSGRKPKGVRVTARGFIQLPDGRVVGKEEDAAAALQPSGATEDKTSVTSGSSQKRSSPPAGDPPSCTQRPSKMISKRDGSSAAAIRPATMDVPVPPAGVPPHPFAHALLPRSLATAAPPLAIPSRVGGDELQPPRGAVIVQGRHFRPCLAHSRLMLTTTAMVMQQQQHHHHAYGGAAIRDLYGTGLVVPAAMPRSGAAAAGAVMTVPPTRHHHQIRPPYPPAS